MKSHIDSKYFTPLASSYVDPHGKLFIKDDLYIRIIHRKYSNFYKKLFENGIIRELISKKKIVESEILEQQNTGDLILKHRRIEPLSYPMEWSPSMLKDSALLTIDLALELLAHNMTLQDATPYNIAFDYSRPLFVDVTSICPVDQSFLWKPYGQFLRLFLFPLILYSFGAYSFARNILYDYYRGIEYSEIRKLLPLHFRIKNFFSLEIPYLIEKYKPNIKNLNISKYADNKIRKKFFFKLKNKIEGLFINPKQNIWLNYYDDAPNLLRKANLVKMIIDEIKPKKVLDMGANTGYFSFILADRGIKTIAIDNSWECVDSIYIKSKEEKKDILPLCIDLLNPTPQFGWNLSQYEDFFKRFTSDFVMMLAILHHLVLKQWQNFERVAEFANQITSKYFLIEFVDEKDEKVKQISAETPEWYNFESLINALGKFFKILKKEKISDTRVLILCKKDLTA